MHGDADILRRLWRAALLRRLPLWLLGTLPWLALRLLPGLLAWVAWCMWDAARLRRQVAHGWSGWLDAAVPSLEDSSALLIEADTPLARLQRQRLLARIDAALDKPAMRRAVYPHIGTGFMWLLPWLALAAVVWFFGQRPAVSAPAPVPVSAAAKAAAVPQLTVTATPPAYTGAATSSGAPRDISLPEGGSLAWCLKNPEAGATTLELSDGRTLKVGERCATLVATESLFWRWRGARYTVKVTPDAPPTITIAQPVQMIQELKPDATSAAMALSVQDDYRVQRATLHLTLARGSGENIKFTDREMPLPASNNPRQRNWAKSWTLAELGMEPGDELYFFVRAADNATRAHTVQSPTYTLRLPAPEVEDSEQTAAMPMLVKPQSLRSQRQIIIDTEQLIADMRATRMSAETVRERSEAIALDQGQLRRRYGQFLGEESNLFGGEEHDDDHAGEAGKMDVLHQFGHAHDEAENATLYDEETKKVLRRALVAMWDAEKALRAISPKTALAPEYKALAAIKELQQADRIYLHKTAFVPPPIREELRMTGDVVGAVSYTREQGGANEAIPSDLRALVAALSNEGALPALWTRTAHDWVRERLKDDEQRLAAQRAIQDVQDGCLRCRPSLRAWLRAGVENAPVLLQAQPVTATPFTRAWIDGGAK
ncbi:DUF4175 family protein [Massilia sp. Leaf139]|uniref:DUF4175 family protein n=1 Tax=Massilia sp. Leaf139 TaxID=1736272 RepID=UPI0006FB55C6|nr:DUF4175 family protein [Massilia sp. Leaf139]KQQ96289.1 hypothetical protein ASF77_21425 [Massilia sp. Leaf139]